MILIEFINYVIIQGKNNQLKQHQNIIDSIIC